MKLQAKHSDALEQAVSIVATKEQIRSARANLLLTSLGIFVLLLTSGLTACGLAPVAKGTSTVGQEIAGVALKMKGVPYVHGGATPAGFDCSGLVYYAYAQAGIPIPRTSHAQFSAAVQINPEQAEPGDLLYFVSENKKSHVAIYIGRGDFVHSPAPGWTVSTGSIKNKYYREKLVGVGRLIPASL